MEKTIIAIDPGTRYWGVSIFKGRDRVLSMVKTFSTKGTAKHRLQAAKLAFLSIFDKYVLDILVIEKPFAFWSKQSKLLNKIIIELKTSAKKKGMRICEYSPRTIRKAICNVEGASKKDMGKSICMIYPEMKTLLKHDKRSKEVYWGQMFDSVGLGVCYLNKRS
jgi:Holliday junction resolvasome RuvABC endonuclease subunit